VTDLERLPKKNCRSTLHGLDRDVDRLVGCLELTRVANSRQDLPRVVSTGQAHKSKVRREPLGVILVKRPLDARALAPKA